MRFLMKVASYCVNISLNYFSTARLDHLSAVCNRLSADDVFQLDASSEFVSQSCSPPLEGLVETSHVYMHGIRLLKAQF
jgi:hypothetical protein